RLPGHLERDAPGSKAFAGQLDVAGQASAQPQLPPAFGKFGPVQGYRSHVAGLERRQKPGGYSIAMADCPVGSDDDQRIVRSVEGSAQRTNVAQILECDMGVMCAVVSNGAHSNMRDSRLRPD